MDSGIDRDHPEFQGRILEGKSFVSNDFEDTIMVRGRSPTEDLPYEYFDNHGHGTQVASVILGQFVGVAPHAKVLVGKVCGIKDGLVSSIVAGIKWGIEKKVDVINMSWGWEKPVLLGRDKILEALEAAERSGIIVVASSGNECS